MFNRCPVHKSFVVTFQNFVKSRLAFKIRVFLFFNAMVYGIVDAVIKMWKTTVECLIIAMYSKQRYCISEHFVVEKMKKNRKAYYSDNTTAWNVQDRIS